MTQNELVELLEERCEVVKKHIYTDKINSNITDITYNSKACIKGSAFFVKGANFKQEYLLDALNNGAELIIAQKEYDVRNAGFVLVKDIRIAMAIIAEAFFGRAYKDLNMIGLTGTKGKTTTATFIHNILNESENNKTGLLSTIETYTKTRFEESHLSTPEAIELQRYIKEVKDNNLKYLTMEVSSQAYKKQRILNMPFNIGLFLNISEDHISPAEHPNFVDYLNCKLEFLKNCETVIANYETDYIEAVLDASKNAKKIITYGTDKSKGIVDYYYTNLRQQDHFLVFDVVSRGVIETYKTQMIGSFNAENAMAAIIVAKQFGIATDVIKRGVELTRVSGRMNVFNDSVTGKTIIVDYAHNRLSFEKFFEAIKKDYPNHDIISVFGAPGGKAYVRRKDMPEIASKYCKYIYLTADDPQFESVRNICNELATFVTCDYEIIEDREEAIKKAFRDMKNDAVLCLLAKGEDKYQQVNGKFEEYISDIGLAKQLVVGGK